MFEKNADLGRQFLFDNYDRIRLEVEYDFDAECIFIQLRDKEKGTCTVLDETGILAQVHEYAEKAKKEQQSAKPTVKRYKLTFQGQEFEGTAEDVARWYCQQKGVKLYIEPREDNGIPALFTLGSRIGTLDPVPDYVDMFEEHTPSFEDGYRLFFTEFMLNACNPDFTIAELS